MKTDFSSEMFEAIEQENLARIDLLIATSSFDSRMILDGQTLLSAATNIGNKMMVELFLNAGCDPNQQDYDGTTALTFSTSTPEIAKTLIAKGAKVSFENSDLLATSLHYAAQSGDNELVKILLDRADGRTKIDLADSADNTPLEYAKEAGHSHTVELLLSYGAAQRFKD